jgi:hypothetical protein
MRGISRKLKILLPFLLFAGALLSCDSNYIRDWYDNPANSSGEGSDNEIRVYYFMNPTGIGVIGGGSGSADDPVAINITYPFGTSVPASDADIHIIHTGASIKADGPWAQNSGVFVRFYTLTATDGTAKHYRVTATEAESTGTSSSGVIGVFHFSATNGLLEGHVNTQAGAVAGVLSDPDTGVYPFTYTLENNTDFFEIAVEDDTALLKITSPLEAKSPWIVRVKVTDDAGSFYAGPVQFVVNPAGTVRSITSDFNFARAPGGLWVHSLGGDIAGTFSPPEDGSGTAPFSYALVAGDGANDADNGSFEIANGGSALSIKTDAALAAAANPYNIYVKVTDSLGEMRSRAFEFNIGVGRIVITNHPPGTHPYTARLYAGSLDAKTFTGPSDAPISEGEAVARSTIADMVVHGTVSPEEGEGAEYALLLSDAESGDYVGYFNGVTFEDGIATVAWPDVWHTFTGAASFSAFMAAPDSVNNNGFPYRIALSGINMETELSAGKSCELYSRLKSSYSYNFDFRGCTGASFTSAANHPNAAQIKEVYLAETLKTVGQYAFDGCLNMTKTQLPPAVETVGNYAFRDCHTLPDVAFPKTIKQIGDYAFAGCTEIKAVDLSGSALESVGQYAFYSVDNLGNGSYNYPSKIASVDFSDCVSLASVGAYAFQRCYQLASVSFDLCSAMTAVGNYAFYLCLNMASIDFSGCKELVTIGQEAFRDCGKVVSVGFSDCVKLKTIDTYAFSYCNALTTVDLSNTILETIGNYAFYNSSNLTTVDLSAVKSTLKTIGGDAFESCSKLATVNLSSCEKLETIGSYAFNGCSQFTEAVDMTKSKTTLKSIGSYAFGYSDIVSINLNGCTALTSIGSYAFQRSDIVSANLTGCSLLTVINSNTFNSCTSLATVTLTGTKIATIGNYAFYGCTKLEDLLNSTNLAPIKTTLTTIGSYAFSRSGVISAEFKDCTVLKTISEYAFDYCASLTGIQLPASLTSVADHAFEHCSKLSTISSLIAAPTNTIFPGQYTFSGIAASFTLLIPSGKQSSYTLFWSSENKPNWQQPGSVQAVY